MNADITMIIIIDNYHQVSIDYVAFVNRMPLLVHRHVINTLPPVMIWVSICTYTCQYLVIICVLRFYKRTWFNLKKLNRTNNSYSIMLYKPYYNYLDNLQILSYPLKYVLSYNRCSKLIFNFWPELIFFL